MTIKNVQYSQIEKENALNFLFLMLQMICIALVECLCILWLPDLFLIWETFGHWILDAPSTLHIEEKTL